MGTNVRNAIKAASIAGAFAMLLPMGLQAAPVFDNWSAANGTITPDPNGYCGQPNVTCTPLVSGDGFLQQEVVEGVGQNAVTYIQTIITDPGAGAQGGTPANQLPYSDESFIRQGATNGIMGQQRSTESTATFNFSNAATLYMGWASALKPQGAGNMNIDQSFTDQGNAAVNGDGLFNSFVMNINLDAGGNVTGKKMSLRQNLGMGDGQADNPNNAQSFVIEQRAGDQNGAAGSLTLAQTAQNNGGTVSWQAGEDVLVTWLGQQVNTSGDPNNPSLSLFGFQSVTNNTTPASASTFSTTQVDIEPDPNNPGSYLPPFDWDAAFGAAPTLTLPPQP